MSRTTTPINILVVDDENFFAEWLAENLQDMSQQYSAHWVTSGERALEFIEQQPVDLVISDIKMGGVSGIELLNRIRAQRPSIGVILMTGYALPELQQDAVKRGSLLYLEKPFPLERLESAIEQALNVLPSTAAPELTEAESRAPSLSLVDTLHLFHLSRSNKMLLVKAEGLEGLIYFQDGEVVHAVSQDREGEAAFGLIVSWGSDDYEVYSDETPPSRTILREFDSLMRLAQEPPMAELLPIPPTVEMSSPPEEMVEPTPDITSDIPAQAGLDEEAELISTPVQLTDADREFGEDVTSDIPVSPPTQAGLDEEAELISTPTPVPPTDDVGEPTEIDVSSTHISQDQSLPASSESISEPTEMGPLPVMPMAPVLSEAARRELLELLAASEQLGGGAVLTTAGTVLASTLPPDALTPITATHTSTLFQMCDCVSAELGRGGHRQSFIQGDLGNVIISGVGEGSYVLFVTQAKATLGLALLQARQRAQKASELFLNGER